jgi:pilus assembly protein Flp/PilA
MGLTPRGWGSPLTTSNFIIENQEIKMLNSIKNFMLDESGLETVEWAIVGGIVVAVGAAVFVTIGGDVSRGLASLGSETSAIQ